MNAVCCVFIFTSYSSMKGSFVVCCLIDFNENHSIVAKVDFSQTELWVPPRLGRGRGRGLTKAAEVGDWGDRNMHDARRPSHPCRFTRDGLIPYPLHSKIPYLLRGESSGKCDYRKGGGKTIFRRGRGGMRGRDKGFLF